MNEKNITEHSCKVSAEDGTCFWGSNDIKVSDRPHFALAPDRTCYREGAGSSRPSVIGLSGTINIPRSHLMYKSSQVK
jgi:hypothetical protein